MSFLSYLINGISLGSVYAIIALGYTMVYGIARMLNFAHGDIIMVGGFVIFTMVSTLGLPPMVGVLVAVIACTVLGVVIERVAYKPLRGASSPSRSDHGYRCQLSAAERSAADLWLQRTSVHICCERAELKAGRRRAVHFRCYTGYDHYLYCDHGGPDYFHQQDQGWSGYAGCIGRYRRGNPDGH